jgi:myxalamid-type polyketide synthase MxaB
LWDQKRVDEFKPGVRFHAVALDQMMAEEPETVGRLMREVISQFEEKTLVPPPLRTFPIRRVVSALRHMARAEHIGKVVIEAAQADTPRRFSLSQVGTYLITGGLGGLGLMVARWLADRGARHIVLVGRSQPTDDARGLVEELEHAGVQVHVKRCDVSRGEEVAALISEIDENLPALVGVFHLAGVLDDATLREQTRDRFDRVMAAKVHGAWNLHELIGDRPLQCFVLFSSAAALLGSPGQGNYAAANAFLDALAHHRRRQGKTALSVNWGSWADVGMAARIKDNQGSRWSAAGIGWIEPARGLQTLERLMAEDRTQAGVLPIDWSRFLERFPPGTEPSWLTDIASRLRDSAPTTQGAPPALLEKLESVTPGERLDVALTYMQQQAARVLAIEDTVLPDPQRPLNELGFDSLTAVEFCNRVGRSIGHHLNPTLLFDYSTLHSLAGYVVQDVLQLESNAPEEAIDDIREKAMDDVEAMSEEEMDALVAEQLEKLQQ